MPRVTVGRHELHVESRGSGPPLLMVQGLTGNHRHWGEPFLAALEPDFELVLYDHRGVGASGPATADEFTLTDLADDAAGLLDELGHPSAHVLGISMGGMVAQELALRHPERVETLVLGCTMPGGKVSTLTDAQTWQHLAAAYATGDRDAIVRAGWDVNVSPRYAAAHPEAFDAYAEVALTLPASLETLGRQLHAIAGHDTVDRLGDVRVPTLVVHGSEDRMLPVPNAHVIAERIPGARLEVLEGVGHLFFWEEPERSAELVRSFCRAARPAGAQ